MKYDEYGELIRSEIVISSVLLERKSIFKLISL